MPPVAFEPTIPAGERPQTYALDRAATGTGRIIVNSVCKMNVTLAFRLTAYDVTHKLLVMQVTENVHS